MIVSIQFCLSNLPISVLTSDLTGNVYIRYRNEEDAQRARNSFNSRWYGGLPVYCDLSPVTDFKEACCRQHETNECRRGGDCNFIHARLPSPELQRELELGQRKYIEEQRSRRSAW
jgi:splicing factor U2AF subunit